jgi:hypothetical protein
MRYRWFTHTLPLFVLLRRGDNFSPWMPCQWYVRGGGEGKRRILIGQSLPPPLLEWHSDVLSCHLRCLIHSTQINAFIRKKPSSIVPIFIFFVKGYYWSVLTYIQCPYKASKFFLIFKKRVPGEQFLKKAFKVRVDPLWVIATVERFNFFFKICYTSWIHSLQAGKIQI